MTLLQPIYCWAFNLIYGVTKIIDDKIRNFIMIVITNLIAVSIIFKSSSVYVSPKIYIALITLLIIFSIDRPIKKIKTNKFFEFIYYAGFIVMFACALSHPVEREFKSHAALCLIILPGLYLIWNNRKDYQTLFNIVAKGFVISGSIYYLYCIVMFPISEVTTLTAGGQYFATISNPNGLGIMALSNMFCAIYLFVSEYGKKRIWYLTIIGTSFALIVLSEARASLVGGVLALCVWLVYYLRRGKYLEKSIIKAIVTIVLIITIIGVSVPIVKPIFSITTPEPAAAFSVDEVMESIGLSNIKDKFEVRMGDKNSFFSGRIELWQYYSKDLTWTGNHRQEFLQKAKRDGITLGPHNGTLDILNQTGIISAVFNLLLQVNVMIFVLLAVFYKRQNGLEHKSVNAKNEKGRKAEYYTFIILISVAFLSISIVENLTKINRWGLTTMFYFAITPLLSDDEWKREFNEE